MTIVRSTKKSVLLNGMVSGYGYVASNSTITASSAVERSQHI